MRTSEFLGGFRGPNKTQNKAPNLPHVRMNVPCGHVRVCTSFPAIVFGPYTSLLPAGAVVQPGPASAALGKI